ncbi:MAG: GNAT family N-acetyltransferase [Pseudomonadota bacterium]
MIAIRPYGAPDAGAFRELMTACRAHYGLRPVPPADEAEMLAELAAPFGIFADLAWTGDRPIGFTCWMRVFPAAGSFAIYLKELFVSDGARGTGAGRALMAHLARRALETGWDQLRWETAEPAARRFYARLGAADDGKTHYVMDGAALRALAASG